AVGETVGAALGEMLCASKDVNGEVVVGVERERIEDALRLLRDEHEYQQLMEIAGVYYPQRDERFDVVYMLLSLTKNHRILVKVRAAEDTPVPTVTTLWPVAGWLEREVDRKSTRLNSSHVKISYAVFCLKKKNK